jgi:hypothetical protein
MQSLRGTLQHMTEHDVSMSYSARLPHDLCAALDEIEPSCTRQDLFGLVAAIEARFHSLWIALFRDYGMIPISIWRRFLGFQRCLIVRVGRELQIPWCLPDAFADFALRYDECLRCPKASLWDCFKALQERVNTFESHVHRRRLMMAEFSPTFQSNFGYSHD